MNIRFCRKKARILSLILFCALTFLSLPTTASSTGFELVPALSAKSAVLIEAGSREILAQKNSDERMGEASTTKIMTALVAAERLSEQRIVEIPKEAVGIEGSSVYLEEGELLSVKELLLAMLLESANDAAAALAIAAGGSIEGFAGLMNEKAKALGLKNTNFVNPHGLYHPQHYTTAYDLAVITAEALSSPLLRNIFATKKATVSKGIFKENPRGEGVRYLVNHNKMLSLYEGSIGVKTGFTKKTGRCLVSAAEKNGMTLIAVTLNASDDWNDHEKLLDYGFANYENAVIFDKGEFSVRYDVSGGRESYVCAVNSLPITAVLPKTRGKAEAQAEFCHHFELAPIEAGSNLGMLRVRVEGKEITSPLVAAYGVASAEPVKKYKFFWQK